MRLLLLFLFLPLISFGQTWTWDSSFVEPVAWYSVKVVKDQQKRVYRYKGHELTRVYDAGGSSNWKISLPQNLLISGVVFDNQSCFIAGTFTGVCQVGATSYTANGADGYIARFALDGTLVWFNAITGPNSQSCGEICLMGNDIAVTGNALDTIRFMGTTPQNSFWRNNHFMFLGKISKNGKLLNLIAANVDTIQQSEDMYAPMSLVFECSSDEQGNLFIFGQFEGKTSIVGQKFNQKLWESHKVIMKFDNSFNVVYCTKIMGDCDWSCSDYRDLHVNTKSQALLIENYSYSQSGNSIAYANLHVFASNGKIDTIIPANRESKGHIYDIDLDSCDNLYLTGYSYAAGMTNYQFSPKYQVTWKTWDTINAIGANILSLAYNECFVFANRGDGNGGNYKHLQSPIVTRCENLTSLEEKHKFKSVKVYPNPFDRNLEIEAEVGCTLEILNNLGQLIRQINLGTVSQEIDTSEYPSGLYFLRVKDTYVKLIKL